MINHYSKAEKNSKLKIYSQLLQNVFTCEELYFVNDEDRAGCPKLRHTTQYIDQLKRIIYIYINASKIKKSGIFHYQSVILKVVQLGSANLLF